MAKSTTKSLATWIILALLFVGLMGFGATNIGGNLRTIGTVGDEEIGVQEYAQELQSQMRAIEQQTGQPLSFAQARQFGIDQSVLSSLVSRATLDNEAEQLGLSVGDARVADEVRAIPAFQGINGSFDREAYAFTLERSNLSEAEFEDDLRDEMSRTLLQGAVVAGIAAPDSYGATLAAYIGEQRSFEWLALDADMLDAPVPAPTDAQLQSYWEENPDAFTRPETKSITYAWLTPAMLQEEVEIDEQALRDLYAEREADFIRPERRLVERLVFGDEATATQAQEAIAAGEADFETLVTDRGLDLADIDLGDVSEDDLGTAGEAVFAAAPGEVVGPFNTSLGPALFRMNAVLAAQETPFEDAMPELREELAMSRARRVIEDRRDGINDLLAGGATLADLAERTEMDLGELDWTEDTQDGIAAYTAFREAAAAAEEGAYPELTDLEDGGLFALAVDEVRPPETYPLDEVREAVAAAWTRAETRARLIDMAETMAASVQEAGGFTDAMPQPNLEEGLTRRSFVEGAPQTFTGTVFSMAEGAVRAVPTPGGAIVVHLSAIDPANPEDSGVVAEQEAVTERAAAGISQDVFDVFTRNLQTRTEVRIDQSAVNSVHNSFQ